jgi:coenzyme F420-reducing hydrogenase gamma subunit
LTLLDCEDELLALGEVVQFSHFAEASSDLSDGPYDITLVEGSISTAHDMERILRLRQMSRYLVTIGACATSGGIQALKNFADHQQFLKAVYARPEYIDTLATSTPISNHVKVDFELRGCPVDKQQLLEVLQSLLRGQRPKTSTESVCQPCKRRGTVCVVVTQGTPCLGPVTQAGCGSICPAFDRGCYGCFGPSIDPNMRSLSEQVLMKSLEPVEAAKLLRSFNGFAAPFANESQRLWQITPTRPSK